MSELTEQERADLRAHNDWKEWGLQFGWILYGSSGPFSAAFLRGGDRQTVNVESYTRKDFDECLIKARNDALEEAIEAVRLRAQRPFTSLDLIAAIRALKDKQ